MTNSEKALKRISGIVCAKCNKDEITYSTDDFKLIEKEIRCLAFIRKVLFKDNPHSIDEYKHATLEEKKEMANELGVQVDEIDNAFEVLTNG